MDGELDVATAGVHADLANHIDPHVAHPLVLAVGQGERRGHGDGVTGVHAERVEILDGADHDHVVVVVAHEFEFELLPPEDGLLQKNFGGGARGQPLSGDPSQVGLVVGHPGSCATHRERRAHDHWVVQILDRLEALLEGVADP